MPPQCRVGTVTGGHLWRETCQLTASAGCVPDQLHAVRRIHIMPHTQKMQHAHLLPPCGPDTSPRAQMKTTNEMYKLCFYDSVSCALWHKLSCG